ncbi:uncharacterized protein PITG_07922 [Phytophthora infestans T30-4]|uniref:Uncharacterized protein n=1 Tax=Phytophthora infestans (strain T30-4) TaxID=403677 RepID=D0NA57_PHYIT|nr:uncharacterized protein PITG_07922 [Phytophthora infestans T30-4]EEY54311.1 hypothetical protein PITG_07922 [Phytophthora infestans T30-4]|eukprot:XP_002904133.1 hypothetical protein PITG_07922 [Phytophthora infestans T30-4]
MLLTCVAICASVQQEHQKDAQQSSQHPPGILNRSLVSCRSCQIHTKRTACARPPVNENSSTKVSSAQVYVVIPRRAEICATEMQGQQVAMRQLGIPDGSLSGFSSSAGMVTTTSAAFALTLATSSTGTA